MVKFWTNVSVAVVTLLNTKLLIIIRKCLILLAVLICCQPVYSLKADELNILIAGSVEQTDIIQEIAKRFTQEHPEIHITTAAGSSLSLIELTTKGQADLLISHYPDGEEKLMAQGFGAMKARFMYNRFALFGPKDDPLNIALSPSLNAALLTLKNNEVEFFTPSDLSGTKKRLDEIWQLIGVTPDWIGYEVSGQSVPNALRTANNLEYYTFVDMSSYAVTKDVINDLAPLFRDDVLLDNYVTVMVLNENKVNRQGQANAEKFFHFITSNEIQKFIGEYGVSKYGIDLFTPYAAFDETVIEQKIAQKQGMARTTFAILSCLLVIAVGSVLFAYINISLRKKSDIQANYDNLTGIGNRRLFTKDSNTHIKKKKTFALLLMDLCGFKEINDTYGHECGDEILRMIASRVELFLQDKGQIYRLGGDEFVVHLYDVQTKDEQLLRALNQVIEEAVVCNKLKILVEASIGIAYFPKNARKLEVLLHMADKAMYQSKEKQITYTEYS